MRVLKRTLLFPLALFRNRPGGAGNSLRALVKYLDNISDKDIVELNIPTGIPLVYELSDDLKPIKHYYLGDPAELKARLEAVAAQGKAKK